MHNPDRITATEALALSRQQAPPPNELDAALAQAYAAVRTAATARPPRTSVDLHPGPHADPAVNEALITQLRRDGYQAYRCGAHSRSIRVEWASPPLDRHILREA